MVAGLLAYLSSLHGDFVFDDIPLLATDPFYAESHSFWDCWTRSFWKAGYPQTLYRPVATLSYWLNAKFCGLAPFPFRLFNLFLHLANSVLVFVYLKKLSGSRTLSFGTALLFSVHPIHSEAVIPAFGRAELLCCFFLLTGLTLHLFAKEKKQLYFLAALSFLLSVWSKEHAIMFLPLCLLQDGLLQKSLNCKKLGLKEFFICRQYILYCVVVIVYLSSRRLVLGAFLFSDFNTDMALDNPLAGQSPIIRLVSAIEVQALALKLIFWPSILSHDYSFARIIPATSPFSLKAILFCGVSVLTVAVSAYLFRDIRRLLVFAALAYMLSVLPSGNFFFVTGTVFAERLLYIPSLWIIVFAVAIFMRISRSIPELAKTGFICVLATPLAWRTVERSADWQSDMSLAIAGIKSSPSSAKVWNNLAFQLGESEDYASAIAAADKALSIHPRYIGALVNRGVYFARLGRFSEAESDFRRALAIDARNSRAARNLDALLKNKESRANE